MSKFHSTVSRRDFMKALGFAGAGIGATAALTPQFNDLDEVMGSSHAVNTRPWWVKERDLLNPTIDVDWDIVSRFDRRNQAQNTNIEDYYYGQQMIDARNGQNAEKARRIAERGPGYTRKTQAFADAYGEVRGVAHVEADFGGLTHPGTQTPEELGVPKWQGTPEENSKLLTAAARIFGAAYMGYAHLDSTYRNKLVCSHTTKKTARFVYEDVEKGYAAPDPTKEMNEKWVIPNHDMWSITIGAPEALFTTKTAPSLISKANNYGTVNMHRAYAGIGNFLHTLGYQLTGQLGHQTMPLNVGASCVLTGIAEQSRQNLYVLTPDSGPRINPENVLTDFPLAPTKPIDAGMWKFCHTCGICADNCPGGWISFEKEPTYEPPDANGKSTANMTHALGPKAFWLDAAGCRMQLKLFGGTCHTCYGFCPFNEGRDAMIHNAVKLTVANVGLFNGFFATLGPLMGYGTREKEAWWDEPQLVAGLESDIFVKYQ
nr:reductive dehalogenase [uncultured bacterium]